MDVKIPEMLNVKNLQEIIMLNSKKFIQTDPYSVLLNAAVISQREESQWKFSQQSNH